MTGTGGSLEGLRAFPKPSGLQKISAVIFYGRPASVSILDCYLKRNLVKNGGMLDEVIWVIRTTTQEDIAWLDLLLEGEPSYKKWNLEYDVAEDYRSAYDKAQNGTMYIKIDDGIVFFEDSVIPTIVHTKWHHPEYYIVSANIMNQPSLSWLHYHMSAVHPYLPEIDPPPTDQNTDSSPEATKSSWRASELPTWFGPSGFEMSLDWTPPQASSPHRWLPLRPTHASDNTGSSSLTLEDTPIRLMSYDSFGSGQWHWTVAAQQHYSFFQNLEENELWRYKFHTWNSNDTRMGTQFVAVLGDDINLSKPFSETDDEYYFTRIMPDRLKRRAIVDGRAIAAYYSFRPQKGGIADTDILGRYKSFAKEHICTSNLA